MFEERSTDLGGPSTRPDRASPRTSDNRTPEVIVTGEILELWASSYQDLRQPNPGTTSVSVRILVRVREPGNDRSLWDKTYDRSATVPRHEVLSPLGHLVEDAVNDPEFLGNLGVRAGTSRGPMLDLRPASGFFSLNYAFTYTWQSELKTPE